MTSSLTASCPALSAPIVLAHGLFGFRRIGFGPLTLTWYFRGIPDVLRASGNRVLVTRVHPTAGIAQRSRKLGQQILEAYPDEPVHVIGHSMGGLDARHLISDPAWKGRIRSLTTIATPHLGSGIADFAKLRVGRIYSLLEMLGVDHRGFFDLTPGAADEFNRRTPEPDWLHVFSVAGDPPDDQVCWPLRRLHRALGEMEGANDGLVSVRSATAFGLSLPNWPVDHLRQMNWLSPEDSGVTCPRVARLYAGLVENLAGIDGDRTRRPGRESTLGFGMAVNRP